MLKIGGRLMTAIGVTLLFLALVVRLAPLSAANEVGDDLAIMVSALVILIGVVAALCARRRT